MRTLLSSIGVLVLLLIFTQPLLAAPQEIDSVKFDSAFLLPQSQPFDPNRTTSKEYRRRLKVHGLRLAPLDANIWGIRVIDRTDSRNLVPIRPYYLRASEDPNFRLQSIAIEFQFEKVDRSKILRDRSRRDPVFDLSFAGKYLPSTTFELPRRDQAYVLRLSAFPLLPSGLFFRSQDSYKALAKPFRSEIVTGKWYSLLVSFNQSGATIDLQGEGEELVEGKIDGENLDCGLVSLITSWHPMKIRELEVNGALVAPDGNTLVKQSGLIPLG